MSIYSGDIKIAGRGETALATPTVSGLVSLNMLLDIFYPIGTIYQSINNINPTTFMGGTWVAWGSGRVPVGMDTGQTEFDTVEETGGAKTHTLDTTQIPSHTHSLASSRGQQLSDGTNNETGWMGVNPNTGLSTYPLRPAQTGGGLAHNNLQPYITCYFWKRTA